MASKKKAAKKTESKSDNARKLREASAAKTAKTPKGKKSPKAAKPEKAPKVAKSVALIPLIDPKELKQLQSDAAQAMQKLEEGIPDFIAQGANLHAVMEDVTSRELWKFAPVPFKSKSAFVAHFAELAHVSERTLFGVMGAAKALPGVSAEKKKEIGPRKLQKLAKAARLLKKKTQNPEAELPAEIIEKAATQPVEEFEQTLQQEGYAEPEPEPVIETASMFAVPDEPGSIPTSAPRVAKSSVSDSATGDPDVDRAIAVAIAVYDPEFTVEEALRFIARMFLKSECTKEGYEDMNNDAAADEIAKPANGKKGKK